MDAAQPISTGRSPRGLRKRGFLVLLSAFAAVSRVDGAEAQAATYENMRFRRDGSVQMGKAAGASTSSMATSSRSGGDARYQLDGDSIALRHADGRVEQRLFYFFPDSDSDNAIGVGGTTLSRRR